MNEGKLILPHDYENKLDYVSTEIAIKYVKDLFERRLAYHLNLMRVSAPLFVRKDSGLNDNLNGVERPVTFDIRDIEGDVEIVHSLAKWKRMALKRYGFEVNKGIYTAFCLCRPVGLGKDHQCGKPHAGSSAGDREEDHEGAEGDGTAAVQGV